MCHQPVHGGVATFSLQHGIFTCVRGKSDLPSRCLSGENCERMLLPTSNQQLESSPGKGSMYKLRADLTEFVFSLSRRERTRENLNLTSLIWNAKARAACQATAASVSARGLAQPSQKASLSAPCLAGRQSKFRSLNANFWQASVHKSSIMKAPELRTVGELRK